jgi:hypothetical protein
MTGDVDEAKNVWQNQQREHPAMSIEDVRTRAHVTHLKAQINLVIAIGLGLVLAAFCLSMVVHSGALWFRLIAAGFVIVTGVLAYTTYKRFWPLHTLASSAALKGCVEFYREELNAQYRSIALWWRFLVPIIIFAFIRWNSLVRTSALVPRTALPFLLIFILVVRRYVAQTFRRKIAALAEFEEERRDPDVSHV